MIIWLTEYIRQTLIEVRGLLILKCRKNLIHSLSNLKRSRKYHMMFNCPKTSGNPNKEGMDEWRELIN